MLTQDEFRLALETEIRKTGSQTALAEKLRMTQSQISDYLRGRFQVENITIGNLYKLFPDTQINLSGTITAEPMERSVEDQLLDVYRQLTPEEKVRCLAIVIANFPHKIKHGTA